METGLRVLRNKNRFRNLVIGVLCALALVANPATSVFAASAYPQNLTNVSVSYSNINAGWGYIDDAVTWGDTSGNAGTYGIYTVRFPCSAYINVSYDDIGSGMMSFGIFNATVNATFPTLGGFTVTSTTIEVKGSVVDEGILHTLAEDYHTGTGKAGMFRCSWYSINQRPYFGMRVAFDLIATYRNTDSAADPRVLTSYAPTISNLTFSSIAGAYMSISELAPDIVDIKNGLLDSSTGWLPTMNTNLQTMVTNQITTNSWLNSIQGQAQVANSHLSDIKTNQVQQIGNQQTQINQLQQIVDYVNSTQAANIVDQANSNFVNNANTLESGQANLENAADASLAAVDTSKIGLIGTYSQSVNWWMRVINWLPTGTGALWDVVVFGFLIAFLLFILRLVR